MKGLTFIILSLVIGTFFIVSVPFGIMFDLSVFFTPIIIMLNFVLDSNLKFYFISFIGIIVIALFLIRFRNQNRFADAVGMNGKVQSGIKEYRYPWAWLLFLLQIISYVFVIYVVATNQDKMIFTMYIPVSIFLIMGWIMIGIWIQFQETKFERRVSDLLPPNAWEMDDDELEPYKQKARAQAWAEYRQGKLIK
jgi:hypothetical protein